MSKVSMMVRAKLLADGAQLAWYGLESGSPSLPVRYTVGPSIDAVRTWLSAPLCPTLKLQRTLVRQGLRSLSRGHHDHLSTHQRINNYILTTHRTSDRHRHMLRSSQRVAACEPCRLMKQACDHSRPTCDRCRRRGRVAECVYRERPFKRQLLANQDDGTPTASISQSSGNGLAVERRTQADGPDGGETSLVSPSRTPATEERSSTTSHPARQHNYPSSGYLGSSSHTTIFNHVANAADQHTETHALGLTADPTSTIVSHDGVRHDDLHCADFRARVNFLDEVTSELDSTAARSLVSRWADGGAALALGGPFVEQCLLATQQQFLEGRCGGQSTVAIARQLSANSAKPLTVSESRSLSAFSQQLKCRGLSWEMLALSLTAVARAALDVLCFPSLYETEGQGRLFQKKLCDLADRCLEIGLGLDCINDLTLVVQYEVWMLYTMADGNQGELRCVLAYAASDRTANFDA